VLGVKESCATKLYCFFGSGDFWCLKVESYDVEDGKALPALQDLLRDLSEGAADWLVWPKDKRGGGKGHHIIDVTKTVRRALNYNVCKRAIDLQYTLGIVYPADRVDGDKHGDFASAENVRKACWGFNRNRMAVGLMHQKGTEEHGTPVESYIYSGPDWEIEKGDKKTIVKSGDWLMGVLWDNDSWAAIKSGKLRGYSLQGWARRA
jgi:hypothetical protein